MAGNRRQVNRSSSTGLSPEALFLAFLDLRVTPSSWGEWSMELKSSPGEAADAWLSCQVWWHGTNLGFVDYAADRFGCIREDGSPEPASWRCYSSYADYEQYGYANIEDAAFGLLKVWLRVQKQAELTR